jgi:hypothetical protein
MKEPTAPQAVAVEVVPSQTTEADRAMVAQLEATEQKSLPGVAYIVKIRLKALPEATSRGWALYVDRLRIPKYWTYGRGIYFKIFDPQFFAEHKGGNLRFSANGTDFVDTGLKLAVPPEPKKKARGGTARLPRQDEVLK